MEDVRIDIAEDETRYFGNALITFHDVAFPSAPVRLFLARRSTDTPYLGTDGWQASPAPLAVELVSQTADKTIVRAGPEICDKIPYSLFIRVQIEGSEITGQAFWPEIMQSPKAYTEVLGDFEPPEISKLVAPPVSQPAVPPPPAFEPPPVVKVEEEVPKAPPRKKSRASIYVLLLLLTAGAGGIGYWKRDLIFPPHKEEAVVPEEVPERLLEDLVSKFERLKLSDTDGHELFALSEQAFTAHNETIGQQAIMEAIARGNQDAKLQRAKWYDPRTFASDRAEAIDANAAARAYFELGLVGNSKGADLLKSLCEASKAGGTDYRDFLSTTYCEGTLAP